jgi:hypothetical protein
MCFKYSELSDLKTKKGFLISLIEVCLLKGRRLPFYYCESSSQALMVLSRGILDGGNFVKREREKKAGRK